MTVSPNDKDDPTVDVDKDDPTVDVDKDDPTGKLVRNKSTKTNGGKGQGLPKPSDKFDFGRFRNVGTGESRSLSLPPADAADVDRKQRVFVEPDAFSMLSQWSSEHIFLVIGAQIEGTTTIAINLALRIIEDKVQNNNWTVGDDYSTAIRINSDDNIQQINSIIQNDSFKDSQVYIIKRVVSRGLQPSELSPEKLRLYQDILQNKKAYIVLTADEQDFSLRPRPSQAVIDVGEIDKNAVFDKHLAYDIGDIDDDLISKTGPMRVVKYELLQEKRTEILDIANPAQIGEIFRRFKDIPGDKETLQENIVAIIEDVTNSERLKRTFFQKLNFNERLFGMLMALLNAPGFDPAFHVFDVEELYHLTTQTIVRSMQDTSLRVDERALIDARMTGINELLETLGLSGHNDKTVYFLDPIVRQNFQDQIVNYHRFLWTMADLLIDITNGTVSPKFQSMSPTVIARLIGQFGIYQPHRLEALLRALLLAEDLGGVQFACVMLFPSIFQPQYHAFMLKQLGGWVPGGKKTYWSEAETRQRLHLSDIITSAHALATVFPTVNDHASITGEVAGEKQKLVQQAKQTNKELKKLLNRLVQQSVVLADDITKAMADSEDFINIFVELNDDDDVDVVELYNEISSEYTAYTTINWLSISLGNLMIAFNEMGNYSANTLDTIVEILIELIESRFKKTAITERFDEILINHILDELENEDNPRQQNARESATQRQKEVIRDSTWYACVAIANHLFLQRTNVDIDIEDVRSSSAKKHNVNEVEPLEDAEQKTEGDEAKTENEAESGTETENVPSVDEETSESEYLQSDDDDKQGKQPKKSKVERNLVNFYDYLRPLSKLLGAMLKASPYFGNLEYFFSEITSDNSVWRYYHETTPYLNHEIEFDADGEFPFSLSLRMIGSPISIALNAFREWFESVAKHYDSYSGEWLDEIYGPLIKLVNEATVLERQYLRDALFTTGWVDSGFKEIRQIAHALIARSYVMDGHVIDLPLTMEGQSHRAQRQGIILLDATNEPLGFLIPRMMYFDQAFNLIQRLSTITPIQVNYLGYDRKSYLYGIAGNDTTMQPTNARSLVPSRRRERLIMPVLEQLGLSEEIAENTHFILVYSPIHLDENNPREIVDIVDLVSLAFDPDEIEIQAQEWDPFAMEDENPSDSQKMDNTSDLTWPWQDKFFLLSSTPMTFTKYLEDAVYEIVKEGQQLGLEYTVNDLIQIHGVSDMFITREQLGTLEIALHRQIIRTIRTLSAEEFEQDLSRYELGVDFADEDAVLDKLETWVLRLNERETANHPRDVTLTMAWSILMIASRNISRVVDLLQQWLTSENILKRLMGASLTHLLFNYYSIVSIVDYMDDGRELLRLLEPFIQATKGRNEFNHILDIIVCWTSESLWARELVAPEGPPLFLSAIGEIGERQVIRDALDLLNYHETLTGLQLNFAKININYEYFKMLLKDITEYVEEIDAEERHKRRMLISEEFQKIGITLDTSMLESLEILCVSDVFRMENYTRQLMQELQKHTKSLQGKAAIENCEIAHRNLRAVADSVRMELYHKLGDTLPPLRENQRYGILIVDISSPSSPIMMTTAITLMRNIQRQLRKEKRQRDIVFTVHRLGRSELVYSGISGSPTPKQMRFELIRSDAALIGPVLDQYRGEDVGFVMVLSGKLIIDLDDWTIQNDWIDHFWVYTTRRSWLLSSQVEGSTRQRNIKKDVQELTDEILNKINR
jgi:hypothetical protein